MLDGFAPALIALVTCLGYFVVLGAAFGAWMWRECRRDERERQARAEQRRRRLAEYRATDRRARSVGGSSCR